MFKSIFAIVALLCGGTVHAHEIGTTRVSVLFPAGRTYEVWPGRCKFAAIRVTAVGYFETPALTSIGVAP